MKAIVLGNRRGVRRLSAQHSYPSALNEIGDSGQTMLDWSLSAFRNCNVKDVVYVGGYHIEKVVKDYPDLHFYYHEDWEAGSDLHALLKAREEFNEDILVVTTDIVFRKPAIDAMVQGKTITTAASVSFQSLPSGLVDGFQTVPGASDRFFGGMLFIPKNHTENFIGLLEGLSETAKKTTLQDIAVRLLQSATETSDVAIDGHWAALVDSASLAQFVLGTKGQTLERFRPMVRHSKILPHITFPIDSWQSNPQEILKNVSSQCGNGPLVVRSSTSTEDSWSSSHAGSFHSELNVDGSDSAKVAKSIDKVFASYAKAGSQSDKDEVLVQPYLNNVSVSGVLFTRDGTTGAPYYIINFDRLSRRTDTVTSGTGTQIETFVTAKDSDTTKLDGWRQELIIAVREIESLLAYDTLDIEWAINDEGALYLLQVRPLIIKHGKTIADDDFKAEIKTAKEFVEAISRPTPYVLGQKTLLGEMPDWNPVEMIGGSPKPLALSLYQTLITDSAWAKARHLCGYRDVRPEPLLYALSGKPFIDVRVSFNSLLPADLPDELAEPLIEGAVSYLADNPELHDKVEFEVIPNCYLSNLAEKLDSPVGAYLDDAAKKRITELFKDFTSDFIEDAIGVMDAQHLAFKELAKRRNARSTQTGIFGDIACIRGLVADCVRYGTVPFSVLARYGFVAIAILRDLAKNGILTNREHDEFLSHIPTIATKISADLRAFQSGELEAKDFVSRYGHLRPGSYDITAPTYKDMAEAGNFTGNSVNTEMEAETGDISHAQAIWDNRSSEIDRFLKQNGMTFTSATLFNFIVKAVPNRELGKFEFTKSLAEILERTASFGEALGFSREDIAYTSIDTLLRLGSSNMHSVLKEELSRSINYEKKRHSITQAIRLPPLIGASEDISAFNIREARPNFVTQNKAEGAPVLLSSESKAMDLNGKIVVLEAADPGCDWIFSHSLAGLITKYGGSASHMAIRSAEFDLPAAIGCGEIIYNRVQNASYVVLNCENQTIHAEN